MPKLPKNTSKYGKAEKSLEFGQLMSELLNKKALFSTQELVMRLAQTPPSTTPKELYDTFNALQKQLFNLIENLNKDCPVVAKTPRENAYACLTMVWIAVLSETIDVPVLTPMVRKSLGAGKKSADGEMAKDVHRLLVASAMVLTFVRYMEEVSPPPLPASS